MQIFHQEIPYALFSLIPVQWHQHDLCPHNFKNYKKKLHTKANMKSNFHKNRDNMPKTIFQNR